ncbi:MAG: FecR domain-containing protein [Thermodesulfobacteriota bacterium]
MLNPAAFRQFFPDRTVRTILFTLCLVQHSLAFAAGTAKIVAFRPEAGCFLQEQRSDAVIGGNIAPGTSLVTGPFGAISLLLPDYMLLKIDENTDFIYQGPSAGGRNGLLKKGKVWLRGRSRDGRFGIASPSATATIRGTEWFMEVDPEGRTVIGILDGRVRVNNDHGSLILGAGEAALIRPGTAPIKTALVMPENAVNWTLRYRPPWDEADKFRDGEAFALVMEQALSACHGMDLKSAFDILAASRPESGRTASWNALAGFLHLVAGKDREAESFFAAAARLAPDWALPLAMPAMAAIVQNRMDQARNLAEKALALQPDSALALMTMALVKKAELDMDGAGAFSRKAVAAAPGFVPARLTAATIALETDDIPACHHLLESIPPGGPHEAEKETLLGFTALREGFPQEALEHFRRARAREPEEADAALGAGIALFNLNRPEEGTRAMAEAALLAPRSSISQSYLAKAFYELKQWDQAESGLDRAKRLDPRDPTPYLYGAMLKYARHRPGEALRDLEKAKALNHNRAVLRSRFLLDQDNAVLMSNAAGIYHELGLTHASTLTAARALETNPMDEGAHRRLYFALLNDPRLYYPAAESELTLAKLFTAPTRAGVVFDESSLSAYQEMFDRAGADIHLAGQFFSQRDDITVNTQQTYTGSVAAKPSLPLAVAAVFSKNSGETRLSTQSIQPAPGYETRTDMHMDQDLDTDYTSAFLKWRPSWNLDLYSELRLTRADTDSDTDTFSSLYFPAFPDLPPMSTQSVTASRSESDMGAAGFGSRLKLGEETQFLVNYSQEGADSRFGADTTIQSLASTRMDGDQKTLRRILQAALWKSAGRNHFQAGCRYADGRENTGSTTTYVPADTDSFSTTGIKNSLLSGHFFHQLAVAEDLFAGWGLFTHALQYSLEDGRRYSTAQVNPVIGAGWDFAENWRLRAAYIEDLAGDRGARLQPVMLAAFPLISTDISDAYTPEEMLSLTQKTAAVAMDYTLPALPLFCGLEAGVDRAETSRFDPAGTEARDNRLATTERLHAYLEALITERLAGHLGWRHARHEMPYEYDEQAVDAGLAYFFGNGATLKLVAGHLLRRPDAEPAAMEKQRIWFVEPLIGWSLLDNDLELELKTRCEDRTMEDLTGPPECSHDTVWSTRIMAICFF